MSHSLSLSLPLSRSLPNPRFLFAAALALSALLAAPARSDADLGISKLDAPDPVETDADFDYVLRITNYGPDTATDVTVVDTLPATTVYDSSAGAGWACGHDGSPTGGVVTCTRPSLAMTVEDGHSEITITVTAPGSAQSLTNNASISAVSPADSYSPNDTVAHGTTIVAPPNGGGTCWAVDDNGGSANDDGLATILKDGTGLIDLGDLEEPLNGNANITGVEAVTFGPFAGGPNLYAADDGRLGTINLTASNPAEYTNIGSFGSGTGAGIAPWKAKIRSLPPSRCTPHASRV